MRQNDARDGAVVTHCMLTHAYAELECYDHMLLATYTAWLLLHIQPGSCDGEESSNMR